MSFIQNFNIIQHGTIVESTLSRIYNMKFTLCLIIILLGGSSGTCWSSGMFETAVDNLLTTQPPQRILANSHHRFVWPSDDGSKKYPYAFEWTSSDDVSDSSQCIICLASFRTKSFEQGCYSASTWSSNLSMPAWTRELLKLKHLIRNLPSDSNTNEETAELINILITTDDHGNPAINHDRALQLAKNLDIVHSQATLADDTFGIDQLDLEDDNSTERRKSSVCCWPW